MDSKNNTYFRAPRVDGGIAVWKQENCQHRESNELYLSEFGKDICTPNHDWGPGHKDHHVIHYIISGKGILMRNNQYFEIGPGEAFYLSPNDFNYYRANEQEPWQYLWVLFNGTKANLIMSATTLSTVGVIKDTDDQFIFNAMKQLHANIADAKINNFQLTGLLYSFLGGLIYHYPRVAEAKDTLALSYIDMAVEYIKANYHKQHIIGDMTKHLNLTRAYVYKLFKKYLECSPSE